MLTSMIHLLDVVGVRRFGYPWSASTWKIIYLLSLMKIL
jgi:hypothetical protein